jgi:iron complex outermembrane receptor protein
VPSPVELTCADPGAPCSLPNQFLADPPLKPVIARTVEAGTRLRPGKELRMTASVYRSVLSDDIQFVTSAANTSAGFFQNAGTTLRQGIDLTLGAQVERVTISAAYSYVRAVYLTPFLMSSPNNSSRNAADQIAVEPGNRIPSIPAQVVKLLADYAPNAQASVGVGWTWLGRQYARGDENNQDAHGPLAGYGVAQAFARYRLGKQWQLSLKIDNVFDRRYQSFGVLGENFFTGPGNSFNPSAAASEQFVTPGAPRALWISLRYETGRP